MEYKLQWIDVNGFHMLISSDYNGLLKLHKLLTAATYHAELFDMAHNSPVRIL